MYVCMYVCMYNAYIYIYVCVCVCVFPWVLQLLCFIHIGVILLPCWENDHIIFSCYSVTIRKLKRPLRDLPWITFRCFFLFFGSSLKRITNEKPGLKKQIWCETMRNFRCDNSQSIWKDWREKINPLYTLHEFVIRTILYFIHFVWLHPKLRMLSTVALFHTPGLLARTLHGTAWLMFSISRIIPLSLQCYSGAIQTRELAGGHCACMHLFHMGTAPFEAFNIRI